MIASIVEDIIWVVLFVFVCIISWIIAWHYFENWMGDDSESKKGKGEDK